ncbi:unnamed protein product [Candida verbasci]|uniref:Uncharacterized protein n=1 Tax=Candida verbasci TaxID=1227364 RepID=A0A9W4TVD0_9ASCO|nr:unnamed protein product [Candida verbasci]
MSILAKLPEIPSTKLIPVFTINLKLKHDPLNIYSSNESNNTLNLAIIETGEIKTVKNELGLQFELNEIFGTDDLLIKNSIETASLDCKLYGKTPKGNSVFIHYGGKVQLNEESVDIISEKKRDSDISKSYVTCNPTFKFDENLESEYKWIEKENFIGRGRFVRDENGSLYVQYYIYIIR